MTKKYKETTTQKVVNSILKGAASSMTGGASLLFTNKHGRNALKTTTKYAFKKIMRRK